MRSTRGLLPAMLGVMLCGGCLPDGLPAYTNDAKTIVTVANDEVWTCDVKTGAARRHPLGDGWRVGRAKMLGEQMWVAYYKGGEDDREYTARRFDPSTGKFIPAPEGVDGSDLVRRSFAASYKGKKCLFLGTDDGMDVLSVPELKKLGTVPRANRRPAGNFWWLQVIPRKTDDGDGKTERIDVYDPRARKVCSIAGKAIDAVNVDDAYFQYARVSTEGKLLLLAFGGRGGPKRFGLFDTATGKGLWGGKTGAVVVGTPLLKPGEMWTIELVERKAPATAPASGPKKYLRPDHVALIRYSPGQGADAAKARREVVMQYRVRLDPETDHYTHSPDGSHFVVQRRWRPTRLLFIPIRKTAAAKDVRVVELRRRP